MFRASLWRMSNEVEYLISLSRDARPLYHPIVAMEILQLEIVEYIDSILDEVSDLATESEILVDACGWDAYEEWEEFMQELLKTL